MSKRQSTKRIVFAEKDKVSEFYLQPYLSTVLNILGHPEAFITDMSMIGDFLDSFHEPTRLSQLAKLNCVFGFNIRSQDTLVDVALRLKEQRAPLNDYQIKK